MSEEKKGNLIVGHMSKDDQAKHLTKFLLEKKYKVQVEILGKTKWAYCDDLAELDPLLKAMKGRIIEVTEMKKKDV